jgi:hypothetical protein
MLSEVPRYNCKGCVVVPQRETSSDDSSTMSDPTKGALVL